MAVLEPVQRHGEAHDRSPRATRTQRGQPARKKTKARLAGGFYHGCPSAPSNGSPAPGAPPLAATTTARLSSTLCHGGEHIQPLSPELHLEGAFHVHAGVHRISALVYRVPHGKKIRHRHKKSSRCGLYGGRGSSIVENYAARKNHWLIGELPITVTACAVVPLYSIPQSRDVRLLLNASTVVVFEAKKTKKRLLGGTLCTDTFIFV